MPTCPTTGRRWKGKGEEMSYTKEREEFLLVLRDEFPDRRREDVVRLGQELMRRATTAQRLSELFCSVEMSEAETARQEKRDEANDAAIEKLCAAWGLKVSLGGDPRGYVVKIHLPSGRYNSWGGAQSGMGVPAQGYSVAQMNRMTGVR